VQTKISFTQSSWSARKIKFERDISALKIEYTFIWAESCEPARVLKTRS